MKKILIAILLLGILLSMSTTYAESEDYDPQAYGMWDIFSYVDEFGLPIGSIYIGAKEPVNGVYSERGQDDSEVTAIITYEQVLSSVSTGFYGFVCIELYMNGTELIANPEGPEEDYDIKILDSDGNRFSTTGEMGEGSSRIMITVFSDENGIVEAGQEPVLDALLKGGSIKIAISEKGNYLADYVLSIDDVSGFEAAYKYFQSTFGFEV